MASVGTEKDSLETYWKPDGSMMDLPVSTMLICGSIMFLVGADFIYYAYTPPTNTIGAALLVMSGVGLFISGFEFFVMGLVKDEILRFRCSMAFISKLDLCLVSERPQ